MAEVKLIVLYPYPADVDKFNRDYQKQLKLLQEKMQIPPHVQPYMVTRFVATPQGNPVYCQMFTMPFPSVEALQHTMSTPAMQEVAGDARRISSGEAPLIPVGVEGA